LSKKVGALGLIAGSDDAAAAAFSSSVELMVVKFLLWFGAANAVTVDLFTADLSSALLC
jgi:hypothetical protein